MKKVLFVASECVPFIKTGGLADVVGSLPKYFNKDEFDVRVILPKYQCMREDFKHQLQYVTHFYMELNWRQQYVGVSPIWNMKEYIITLLTMSIISQVRDHMEIFMRILRSLHFSLVLPYLLFR